jgi:FixJ family two-component response regulator
MDSVANPTLISVVDDDESVRESLEGLMRSVGLAVKTFASAEEFLNSDQHLNKTDCLITDLRMPGTSGLELQRRLIADRQSIPVIFITAHGSDSEARAEALRNGALAFLDKPLSEDALLDAVHRAVQTKG